VGKPGFRRTIDHSRIIPGLIAPRDAEDRLG
jgi:hypothetical protein